MGKCAVEEFNKLIPFQSVVEASVQIVESDGIMHNMLKTYPGLQIRVCNWKLLFLFLNQNICCGYSKELSQWDSSFEHPKHTLKWVRKYLYIFTPIFFFFCLTGPMLPYLPQYVQSALTVIWIISKHACFEIIHITVRAETLYALKMFKGSVSKS